jgi:signal transduction histidine kinase
VRVRTTLAALLERFVRLDDARARDAGGSGLGLAIVAELVAAHGGTVGLAGSPLGGTRVEVSLPVTPGRP